MTKYLKPVLVLIGAGSMLYGIVFTGQLEGFAANVSVTGTSTYVAVFDSSNGVTGYSDLTFISSTKQFILNGPSSLQTVTFTNASGTNLDLTGYLKINGDKVATSSGAGAGVSGSNKDVQFNNSGSFGADTGVFTYDKGSKALSLNSATSSLFIGTTANFATSSGGSVNQSVSFSYTGAVTSWTVPAGVTSITINAQGSVGQNGAASLPGKGGSATGTLAVSPGQTYYISVGATSTVVGTGGFGGGGNAGNSSNSGGGGMSWFSSSSTFSQASVILVAGGGGGNGSTGSPVAGGDGGGLTGGSGANTPSCSPAGGGSQSSGGGGGGGNVSGNAGSAGQGGSGGVNVGEAGAGGGGGYYGGGGGGAASTICDGAGGGGSSFMRSTLTSTSTASGVSSGNGSVTITYTVPAYSTVFSTSTAALYVGGHITTGNQSLVTVSVSSCGTAPRIVGNDTAGSLTVGGAGATSCTVNFGAAFANVPVCVANDNSNILAIKPTVTSSTLTLAAASSFSGDTISFICLDHN